MLNSNASQCRGTGSKSLAKGYSSTFQWSLTSSTFVWLSALYIRVCWISDSVHAHSRLTRVKNTSSFYSNSKMLQRGIVILNRRTLKSRNGDQGMQLSTYSQMSKESSLRISIQMRLTKFTMGTCMPWSVPMTNLRGDSTL
jgi:hypothetical protein